MKQIAKTFIISTFAIMYIITASYAQDITEQPRARVPEPEEVFTSKAATPQYPGGEEALFEFIKNNFHLPKSAYNQFVDSEIVVQFAVEKDGSIGEVKVIQGGNPDIDQEVVRVFKMLSDFTPGLNVIGDPIRVVYTLPISLNLTDVEVLPPLQDIANQEQSNYQKSFFVTNGLRYSITDSSSVSIHDSPGYKNFSGPLTIPSSVTYNGKTYSVTSIYSGAFSGCTGLTSITIPNSVTLIGSGAFSDCTSLTSLILPNSLTSIGHFAFEGCTSLTSVTIPSSVISIGKVDDPLFNYLDCNPFSGCSSLVSIVVASGNPKYDSRNNCNAIIETETNKLVSGCKNTVIPNSVTSIGDFAFKDCTGMTSVTIPYSVKSIGVDVFSGCSGITSIVVDNDNPRYDSKYNCNAIIETKKNELIVGCKNTVIPNWVTSIGSSAFDGCRSLTSVTIPHSVIEIGESAFKNCNSLTSVTIPSSVMCMYGRLTFEGCSNLTSIVVESDNPKYDSRDNCNAIIETETNALFVACNNTRIPSSVTYISSFAFRGGGFSSIVVEDGNPKYDSRDNCNAIIETETNTLYVGCRNTIIPNSVTSISDWAFESCKDLVSMNFPNSVTEIGDNAFSDCTGLTSVNIGNSVTSIGKFAFSGCTGLTSVTIPNSTTSIGDFAFSGCTGLTSVTTYLKNPSSKKISNDVFGIPGRDYYDNCVLKVPVGMIKRYKNANQWQAFLKIVEIK